MLSRAARDDRERLGYVMQRIFEAALVGGVGLSIAMSAGAGFIVSVIGGRNAAAATPVLEIQSFALIASFLAAGWGFGLLSLREHRGLFVANAVAGMVSLAGTLLLARTDGARGAAIATVCGESALGICALTALVARHPNYRPQLDVLWKVLLAGGLAAAAGFAPPPFARARGARARRLHRSRPAHGRSASGVPRAVAGPLRAGSRQRALVDSRPMLGPPPRELTP